MPDAESRLKKNMPLLMILTVAGAFVYALPYLRLYYYDAVIETFRMTNEQAGLCGTLYGTFAAVLYLVGWIIADRFSIKKLLSISLLVTGVIGFYMLIIPPPVIVALIHRVWGITTIMTFWPALMKILKTLGNTNEQGEDGRIQVSAIENDNVSRKPVLYFDIRNPEDIYDCDFIYTGEVIYGDTNVNFLLHNTVLPYDVLTLTITTISQNQSYKMGILTTITFYYQNVAIRCLTSKTPVRDEVFLMEKLQLSADDMKRMKASNFFIV